MNSPSRLPVGALLAVVAQFGFASKAIFIKLAYAAAPALDAVTLLALRMLLSLPFFLLLAGWARRRRDGKAPAPLACRDWGLVVFLAFIGYYLSSFLDFWGLQHVSAALERLILFTNPTWVLLLSALFLGVAITRRAMAALALSYAGLLLAYGHDLRLAEDPTALVKGTLLVLGAALCYAVYLVVGSGITRRIGSARFTAYMMLVASAFVLAQFVAVKPWSALILPSAVYLHAVGLAVVSSVLPVWAMAEALRRLGRGETAMIGTIGPVLTIGLGAVFLGEAVSLLQLAGAVLVLAGVGMVSLR
ncbi:MAG: DMT family transporter [Casimicrobiaceae bacterium]